MYEEYEIIQKIGINDVIVRISNDELMLYVCYGDTYISIAGNNGWSGITTNELIIEL